MGKIVLLSKFLSAVEYSPWNAFVFFGILSVWNFQSGAPQLSCTVLVRKVVSWTPYLKRLKWSFRRPGRPLASSWPALGQILASFWAAFGQAWPISGTAV